MACQWSMYVHVSLPDPRPTATLLFLYPQSSPKALPDIRSSRVHQRRKHSLVQRFLRPPSCNKAFWSSFPLGKQSVSTSKPQVSRRANIHTRYPHNLRVLPSFFFIKYFRHNSFLPHGVEINAEVLHQLDPLFTCPFSLVELGSRRF